MIKKICMKKSRTILTLCAISISVASTSAQKIHAISFCNTTDEKIGESCLVDHERFVNEVDVISAYINYDVEWYSNIGDKCSKENLEAVLENLNCTNKDVVLFYYSGHGVHAKGDQSAWPQMCLKYNAYEEEKFVPVRVVDEALTKKNPRLRIILTDCCNNVADWVSVKGILAMEAGSSEYSQENVKNYRKLFIEQGGSIIATGSKKGQYSYCTSKGGYFSIAFWDQVFLAGKGKIEQNWNTVLSEMKKTVLEGTDNEQEPYYSANVYATGSAVQPPDNDNTNGGAVISVSSSDFSSRLSVLLDSNVKVESRLSCIPSIISDFFTTDAMIATVGRNGETIVEMETVQAFLKRLCLSSYIKQINVIDEKYSNGGKRSYVKVHEIRIK